MPQVTFHFNVPDKAEYGCRLLRKAVTRGVKKVLVTGPAAEIDALDRALWTFSAREFLPHCRSDAPPDLLDATPIVLTEAVPPGLATLAPEVLVNLGSEMSPDLTGFDKWIELVSEDPQDRSAARHRWKAYAAAGHAMRAHDVLQPGRTSDE